MVKKNKITLAEAIDCSGLKTEFIAKNVGVSRQTIYNYKHGHVDIPYSRLVKLCKILGVSVTSIDYNYTNKVDG